MRKVILQLAVSLDGFIEGPHGEFDWCLTDDDYGMTEFYKRIDAIFIGRKSYEVAIAMGDSAFPGLPPLQEYVFSNSLKHLKGNGILVNEDLYDEVQAIKNSPGKDIWLYGGAALTSSFINMGLVDQMALAVHPILLGSGKSLFRNIPGRKALTLIDTVTYPSGLVMLTYNFS